MKNITIIFFFFLMAIKGYSQSPVNNEGVRIQTESMVITRWNKRDFRPKLYYQLIHNKYRKGEDRRLAWQILPNLLSSQLNKEETEIEDEKVEADYKDEIAMGLDQATNLKYDMLYKDHLTELFARLYAIDFRSALNVLEGFENPFKPSEHLLAMQNFEERKKVITDSYSPSHEKNLNYDKLIDDMEFYMSMLAKVKRKLEVMNKYAPLIKANPVQ